MVITHCGLAVSVLSAAPEAVCMFNDGETVRLNSLLAYNQREIGMACAQICFFFLPQLDF